MKNQKPLYGRTVICKCKSFNDLQNKTRLDNCGVRTIRGFIDHFTGDKFIIFDHEGRLHIIPLEMVVEMHEIEAETNEPFLSPAEKWAIEVALQELARFCGANYYMCAEGKVTIDDLKDKLLGLK